jgi:hypothetical protein
MVYTARAGCAGIMTIKAMDFFGGTAIKRGIIGGSNIYWNLAPQPFF